MDLRQLRYFTAIVDAGAISRAAEILHVAQPALSAHLKALEAELGTALLLRSRAGVQPTEAGLLLARRARTILDDVARLGDDLRTLGAAPTGIVRVGLPGTISAIVSLPLIQAAAERYPGIRLNVAEAMSGFIADWLGDGVVDMAVLYGAARDEGLRSDLLLEEELVVIWPAGTAAPAQVTLKALEGQPMVLPSGAHGLRGLVDRAMEGAHLQPRIAVEIDSYANIKRLVAAGHGASILPLHAVSAEVAAGQLALSRIAAPGLWRGAHLITPSGRPRSRAQEAITDLLRDLIVTLRDTGTWEAVRKPI